MDMHLTPIGYIRSSIKEMGGPAKMEDEPGAVAAFIEILPEYETAARDLKPGMELELFTWLHKSDRTVQEVHPRGDTKRSKRGIFATRSPARPNPIGLHRVKIKDMESQLKFSVEQLEAIDGTPIVDIKPERKK